MSTLHILWNCTQSLLTIDKTNLAAIKNRKLLLLFGALWPRDSSLLMHSIMLTSKLPFRLPCFSRSSLLHFPFWMVDSCHWLWKTVPLIKFCPNITHKNLCGVCHCPASFLIKLQILELSTAERMGHKAWVMIVNCRDGWPESNWLTLSLQTLWPSYSTARPLRAKDE